MNICIYYFSGTGNTEIVSNIVKSTFFKKYKLSIELRRIDKILKNNDQINSKNYDMIGIAYPIYGLGTPSIINKFINLLPYDQYKKVFVYKTAADFININNNSSKYIIKKLIKKGYNVFYDRIIVMGSNWFIKYDDRLSKQLYNVSLEKVEHMCNDILNGTKRIPKINIFIKLLSIITKFGEENFGSKFYGRMLKTTNLCNNCYKCVNECPTENIVVNNGKIKFKWKCIWCMKCVYNCSKSAIKPRILKMSVVKDGYYIKKIIKNNDIKGNFVDNNTKGFFKHFNDYIINKEL